MPASDSAPRSPAGTNTNSGESRPAFGLLSPNRLLPVKMQRAMSPVFELMSWQDSSRSMALFLIGLALWGSHNLLGMSLSSIVAQLATVTLTISALIQAHNGINAGKALPALVIPLQPEDVRSFFSGLGDRLASAVIEANGLLSWRHPASSARAWAYAWLAVRFAWFFTAPVLLTLWLVCFTIGPLYGTFQKEIDGALVRYVQPHFGTLNRITEQAMAAGSAGIERNRGLATVVLGSAGLAGLYTFWSSLSMTGIATVSSLIVLGIDAVAVAAGGKDRAGEHDD